MSDDPRAVELREKFGQAGFRFLRDDEDRLKVAMPLLDLPSLEKYQSPQYIDLFRLSGQHLVKIEDDPTRALDPENLVFMTGRENVLMDIDSSYYSAIRRITVARWLEDEH